MSPYMKDALERVVSTFIVAALGSLSIWLAAGAPTGRTALLAALTPVAASMYDIVKVVLAKYVGDNGTASFLKAAK